MTEDQIKQNAEAYAELLMADNKEHYWSIYAAAKEGYISGAHSRDEEIEKWKNLCDRLTIEKWKLQKKLHDLDN